MSPTMPEYGVLVQTRHGSFEWGVDDFISFDTVRSPTFIFERVSFHLRLSAYPREDRLQLSIHTEVPSWEKFQVTFEMGTEYGGQVESRSCRIDKEDFHIRRWMPWSELLRRRLEILRNGCLVVTVRLQREETEFIPSRIPLSRKTVNEISPEETLTTSDSDSSGSSGKDIADSAEVSDDEDSATLSESVMELRNALKSLLKSGENSDFTVRVQGREFPVHKCILGSRSAVFRSMLQHDMAEKMTGGYEEENCDPQTFEDFLHHLYTGSTKRVCSNNVFTLYPLSHKYVLHGLKEACVSFIKSSLSCETFPAPMSLALLYGEQELVRLGTEFFCDFADKIVDTVEWQKFLQDNPTAGNKLFRKVLNAKRQA